MSGRIAFDMLIVIGGGTIVAIWCLFILSVIFDQETWKDDFAGDSSPLWRKAYNTTGRSATPLTPDPPEPGAGAPI